MLTHYFSSIAVFPHTQQSLILIFDYFGNIVPKLCPDIMPMWSVSYRAVSSHTAVLDTITLEPISKFSFKSQDKYISVIKKI